MRNKLEDIHHDEEDDDVDEKDDDDDAMNNKEFEGDKQEANHEDKVDIYDEDNKSNMKMLRWWRRRKQGQLQDEKGLKCF